MHRIMFTLLITTALTSPTAQAVMCPHFEYAELQSMTIEELRSVRGDWAMARLAAMGNRRRSEQPSDADRSGCATEEGRIERVIQAKMKEQEQVVPKEQEQVDAK